MESKNLIAKIKNGDERVFEQVYKEYYARLYYYIFGYTKNSEDTKEIVQNTFIILWNKKDQLTDDTRIYAWLFTVVKNQCLNHIREKERRLQHYKQVELFEKEILQLQTQSIESFLPDEITLSELQEIIDKATREMPDQCRKIFLLSRLEGLSHKEISEQLNISTKTIENQITKALHILRSRLTDYHFFVFLLTF